MKNDTRYTNVRSRHEAGFTLVEMLISVALVLLMMSLFASIFVEATKSLSTQRGIAENDQRGRMLSITLRADLNGRTFRDLLPWSPLDTPTNLHPNAVRNGYFEIDECDPNDDTDDVLQFTTSINLPTPNPDGLKFTGLTNNNLTNAPIASVPTSSSIILSGNWLPYIGTTANTYLWIYGSAGASFSNDGRYRVSTATPPSLSGGNTTITLMTTSLTVQASAPCGNVLLSELDPDFDDGVIGNSTTASAFAEVSYFLRNQILYRRVLLIRDAQTGTAAQPQWSNNATPMTTLVTAGSTFWRDYDCSAFFPSALPVASSFAGTPAFTPPNAPAFHDATSALSNAYVATPAPLGITKSLGLPFQRFGHSSATGLPQDASTVAYLPGTSGAYDNTGRQVNLGRFTLQECSNASFGYPGVLPIDPISGAANTNPFDRRNIQVDANSGMVVEYTNAPPYSTTAPYSGAAQNSRRGQDILMTNVLSFDVKVWDPINAQFVNIGDSTPTSGPFSQAVGVLANAGTPPTIVGGALNSTYGAPPNHYRFDTWHPNAAVLGSGGSPNNEPPYYGGASPTPPLPQWTYTYPPYIPAWMTPAPSSNYQSFPLSAIQITIVYRDISSNQIRSMTVVQSLIDKVQQLTKFNSNVSGSGVYVPTLN